MRSALKLVTLIALVAPLSGLMWLLWCVQNAGQADAADWAAVPVFLAVGAGAWCIRRFLKKRREDLDQTLAEYRRGV
jgi:hypothetical protein